MSNEHSKPLVGGSDAHALGGIGVICTEVSGKSVGEILKNIKRGKCRPVQNLGGLQLKASILTDKISRKYHLSRKL
jgi:hypothetical protein